MVHKERKFSTLSDVEKITISPTEDLAFIMTLTVEIAQAESGIQNNNIDTISILTTNSDESIKG
ncbi:hypothetical protein QTA56_16220 [Acinetobacter sp. VNH17]|uniref:Uncharacterized protein n=1 Tax=Acinetobacter thutiue TaxID=2998078 RepID=A0ABT7WSW2_9GAMM|nr:hypothetical protein [Acinetobacter thutiue]MCY6413658.1 hypothetical protein [Acinetobacter thutiue]MDN0015767.1 hypothetical protein [Acinetobacter thutiue]